MQTSQVHTSKVSTYIDIELFMLVSILSYSVFMVYSVLINNNWNTQLWFKILPSQSVNPMPFTMSLKREREKTWPLRTCTTLSEDPCLISSIHSQAVPDCPELQFPGG